MKTTLIGCMHMSGVGKDSKRPYSFARLYLLAPIENISNEIMTRKATGFEAMELDIEPESVGKFLAATYPLRVDLETDMVPRAGKMVTVAIGFKVLTPTAA